MSVILVNLGIYQDYTNDKIFENLYFIDLNFIKILPNIVIKTLSKKLLLLIGSNEA